MDILIAEDSRISRSVLKKLLKKDGHQIFEAVDGKEAWQLYLEQKPDIVITDWMMPEMDGIALCREIRNHKSKKYSYIMMLTSKGEIDDRVAVFDAGADDYISKPVKPQELRSRIKNGQRVIQLEKKFRVIQNKLVKKNLELNKALADLKIRQSQMLQSEKLVSIGQLSAGVAHEINNPIGFITGNIDTLSDYFKDVETVLGGYQALLQMLKSNDGLSSEVKQQVQKIEDIEEDVDIGYLQEDIPDLLKDCLVGSQRIARIVNDLKTFARPGNEGFTMVDINSGIKSTLNVINNEIKYKAEVKTDYGELDMIEADPQKLNQVFMNLLLNAGQAIEKDGEIKIQTRQDDTHIRVTICDNGCGISPEHLSRVFEPFYTTKAIGQGTGLGLSSSYDIIQEHKGKIDVKSKKGQGTCLTISLPVPEDLDV